MRALLRRARERVLHRLAMMLSRELCYWVGVRMLSEQCRADLSRCSKVARAARAGHFRMVHVCEEFVNRGRRRG